MTTASVLPPLPEAAPWALAGATLWVPGAPPRPVTLVVHGDRIDALLDASAPDPFPAGSRVDLPGAWILPGLLDVHVHPQRTEHGLALLAHGVTAALDPAPQRVPEASVGPGGATASPADRSWPTLFRAGRPLDGPGGDPRVAVRVQSTAEARAAVRDQIAAGHAFVKLYSHLPPPLVAAATAEAHAGGARVVADLAVTSWIDAARAGVDVLCHAWPQHPALLPKATREAHLAALAAGAGHPLVGYYALLDPEDPAIDALVEALLESGTALVPTLATLDAHLHADAAALGGAPLPGWPPVPTEARETTWQRVLAFLHRLGRAGVPLLAGTDAPRRGVPPGASLWRELHLLTLAGAPREAAWAAATTRAAGLLGLAPHGEIRVAGPADLLILAGDPRSRPGDLGRLRGVLHGGRWIRDPRAPEVAQAARSTS